MTADESLTLLRALFSDPIEEYKEVREEVGDKDYLGSYMIGLLYSGHMDNAIYQLFEVLAGE